MFLVGELGATINADRSPFDRTLRGVFRDGGRMMRQLGSQMTMALTVPLAGAGALAVKTAADYERLQVQLNTLAGSAEEGAMAFKRLQDFSAGTPFQLNDLIKANNIIVGMGRSMNEAFSDMQMLGDVASATGANIGELAVTFGQAAAEGKLMTRDIREFINRGIPLTKLLAESMGVATNEIFDLASQGKITFDTLLKALQDATTGTGLYANATEEAANTIHGVWSTLKDNTNRLLSEIGNSIVDTFDLKGVMKDLTGQIQIGIDWFNSLSEETRRMAFYVAGLLGASGPIIAALGTLGLALSGITAPIAAAVAAVAGGAALLISNWEEVEDYFTRGAGSQMWGDLKEIVSNTVFVLTDLWEQFGDNIIAFSEGAFSTIFQVIETTLSAINDTIAVWTELYSGNFEKAFVRAESSWKDHLGNLKSIIQTGLLALREIDVLGGYKLWEFLGLIPDQEELNRQYAQAMREAVENARAEATGRGDDFIFDADIDLTEPNVDFDPMGIFEGASNPINQADMAAKSFGTTLSENVTQGLQNMRAAVSPATEGLSLLQIGAMNVGNELTRTQKIGMVFGETLGNIFSQAALHGRDLLGVITNIAKQLASRAIITGLGALLTGGTSLGGKSFLGALFGGFRANGGDVFAGQAYRVGEMNQPEMFIPTTNGSVQPISGGGSSISQRSMQMAFEKALGNYVKGVSDRKIFEMAEKGRFG